jgi:hypothetical protein
MNRFSNAVFDPYCSGNIVLSTENLKASRYGNRVYVGIGLANTMFKYDFNTLVPQMILNWIRKIDDRCIDPSTQLQNFADSIAKLSKLSTQYIIAKNLSVSPEAISLNKYIKHIISLPELKISPTTNKNIVEFLNILQHEELSYTALLKGNELFRNLLKSNNHKYDDSYQVISSDCLNKILNFIPDKSSIGVLQHYFDLELVRLKTIHREFECLPPNLTKNSNGKILFVLIEPRVFNKFPIIEEITIENINKQLELLPSAYYLLQLKEMFGEILDICFLPFLPEDSPTYIHKYLNCDVFPKHTISDTIETITIILTRLFTLTPNIIISNKMIYFGLPNSSSLVPLWFQELLKQCNKLCPLMMIPIDLTHLWIIYDWNKINFSELYFRLFFERKHADFIGTDSDNSFIIQVDEMTELI